MNNRITFTSSYVNTHSENAVSHRRHFPLSVLSESGCFLLLRLVPKGRGRSRLCRVVTNNHRAILFQRAHSVLYTL